MHIRHIGGVKRTEVERGSKCRTEHEHTLHILHFISNEIFYAFYLCHIC